MFLPECSNSLILRVLQTFYSFSSPSLLVNHKVLFIQPPNYPSGMTLPLLPFCYRSGSDPHPLLFASLQQSLNRTPSLHSHLPQILSIHAAANQNAVKHRYDHITSLLYHWLPIAHSKKLLCMVFPPLLSHSINNKPPWPPLRTTTPCFYTISSAGNVLLPGTHLNDSLSFKTQYWCHLSPFKAKPLPSSHHCLQSNPRTAAPNSTTYSTGLKFCLSCQSV